MAVAGICVLLIAISLQRAWANWQVLTSDKKTVAKTTKSKPKQEEKQKVAIIKEKQNEPTKGSIQTDPIIEMIRGSTIYRPVTVMTDTQLHGVLRIQKEQTEYRLTYGEIRAQGWLILDGENTVVLTKGGMVETIPISRQVKPIEVNHVSGS